MNWFIRSIKKIAENEKNVGESLEQLRFKQYLRMLVQQPQQE